MAKPLPKWKFQNFPPESTESDMRIIVTDLWPDGKYATKICKQCGRFSCEYGIAGLQIPARIVPSCKMCEELIAYEALNEEQIMG